MKKLPYMEIREMLNIMFKPNLLAKLFIFFSSLFKLFINNKIFLSIVNFESKYVSISVLIPTKYSFAVSLKKNFNKNKFLCFNLLSNIYKRIESD